MKIYSVTDINNHIKLLFMKDNVLSGVSICGEISDCKYHTSGHIYFTLKDSGGQLACVMFAGKRASGLNFKLEPGQSVIVTGSVSIYERDGKYQLYADRITKEGKGELYERFEQLKQKLLLEGLFDNDHKKPIPQYIRTLGVITAATGAAIQDIINITTRRNPYVKIVLYPAKVQGAGAARTLINGIHAMEKIRPDVIIIGRGGGSFEDLFEFNDEELARAIYVCDIPVISAVGHEVDFTICDYVSDLRAPTPSAGAELAVYQYSEMSARFVDYHYELYRAMNNRITDEKSKLDRYRLKLNALSPASRLDNYRLRLDSLSTALYNQINSSLNNTKHRLSLISGQFERLSPLNSLARGYSYVTGPDGHNITSVSQVSTGDLLRINTTDGAIEANVVNIYSEEDKNA